MRDARVLSALLALAVAGCGGGGGSASTPASTAGAGSAKVTMTIGIPNRPPTSARRLPQYVSDGTHALAIYDGATLLFASNIDLNSATPFLPFYTASGSTTVTPNGCTRGNLTSTCTLTFDTTAGPHTWGVTAYGDFQNGYVPPESNRRAVAATTGSPPTFTGLILSEGEASMTATVGSTTPLTITLLGVADIVQWFGPQTASYNQSATIGYAIQDARSGQIVTPGDAYDNGPVTITADHPELITFTPISQSTPPSINGSQTFNITCTSQSGGVITFTASAGTHPNATYANGLTYSSSNYSSGTLSTRGFRCFGS